MRILVIEDEPNLRRQLESALEQAGYAVDTASDGEDGHYMGANEAYDAVILDLGLPGLDGLTVLDRWRREGKVMPVLVLTARDSWSDKVAGLDAGADDYLAKPFQIEELVARLRALIRRAAGQATSELTAGGVRLDGRSGRVTLNGEPVKLTAQEFKLLSYLMHHKGKVVSRTELIEHIYDQDFDRDSNTIEVFITRIRKKLGADLIMTTRGLGYSLNDQLLKPAAPGGLVSSGRSLRRRMIVIAAVWITMLLGVGGLALVRVLDDTLTASFDEQLDNNLDAMINAAELDEVGDVRLLRPLGDQRFAEPYSGLYWQVSGGGHAPFPSRSLWDRQLAPPPGKAECLSPCKYESTQFAGETLRVMARSVRLPGGAQPFLFQVAQSSRDLDLQLTRTRIIVGWSLGVLGIGLIIMVGLQSIYGLAPLRRVSDAIAAIRSGRAQRVEAQFPVEVEPLVAEINELLAHGEAQSEAARRHAGNLAHALKTPMSVLVGEARGRDDPLARAVEAQVQVMRRHVDHQLARARAAGQRSASLARTPVWPSLEAIARTVGRIHQGKVLIDLAGNREAAFRGERQDLEEMLGNLIDNAALHGGGRVFITVEVEGDRLRVLVEDDGKGIAPDQRSRLFERGERLDTDKPGTGLGLAIVKDVAELYGGSVELAASEDLGGLLVVLTLPRAA